MRTIGLFILFVAVGGAATVQAQAPVLPVSSVVAASSSSSAAEPDTAAVRLLVGRSTVVDIGSPISRVSLTSADVADAMVTGPNQLLINGKIPGTISMFVWSRSGAISKYEVIVQRDLARLNDQIKELFPGEEISVQSNGKSVVLSGRVSKKEVIERAVDVAAGYVEKKDDVVTLLQIRDGGASNQVLLRVRFAEVSRSAMMELGSSFFTGINGYKDYIGRSSTQQFSAPDFDLKEGGLVFSDYLNMFLFNTKEGLGTVIKALQTKGLFQSLAEPNLVAESGKEASFLAGGEIPVPVATGSGGNVSIAVQYKEFGVRLSFTPTVNGDRIHLKVRPEVSTLDFNNAVVLNGFRIPALSTRRTETELELQNGQTFAIAGLMNNTVNSSMRKIPGIGDIPILGLLFRSKGAEKNQTELVVMITPEILPNNSTGVTSRLPLTPERFIEPVPTNRLYEQPAPAFKPNGASRSGDSGTPRLASEVSARIPAAPAVASQAPVAPAAPVAAMPAGPADARTAAAAVSALTPQSRSVIQSAALTAPAPAVTAAPTPAQAVTRPLTDEEQKVVERARKQEEASRVAAARVAAQQAVADRRQQEKETELKAEQAKQQARLDAEAARRSVEQAKRDAELEKKRQKALGEVEARRQEAMKEAEEKLKAAQASYQSEVSKHQK